MSRRLMAALSAAVLTLTLVAPTVAAPVETASGEKAFTKGGTYIVQLEEYPVVAYDGSIKGYRATKPAPGAKIDPDSTDVVKYVGYLKSRHDAVMKAVGATKKLYDYSYSYNGFAAKLTARQANALAVMKGVVAVSPDQLHDVDTSSTPAFLGLSAPGGLWEQLGGPTGTRTVDGAGEDIVIGVVDSGVWPESKSFSDRNAADQLIYANLSPAEFHGKCDGAAQVIDPAWDASRCNKKLIAAQHFNASWGGNAALEAERPWEFQSPRDYNGHGTHTSSTAGGNFNVLPTGPAASFGPISGMAPRARIATYKALWSTQSGDLASGFTGDLVAAIDQAVADGVDVINYSVSGSQTNFFDPSEVSFLFAAQAGIFVAASAGNSGPTAGTVAHGGPWLTTVAAGTHNRNGSGSVTLGNGVTYPGASVAAAVGPAPLIDSISAGLPGADPAKVELCYSAGDNAGTPVLDPAKVAGKIVICKRGVTARVNKSAAVLDADGVGMVLYNNPDSSLNADFHFVPTVHVNSAAGLAIKTYAAGESPTATINQSTLSYTDPAPFTASFSSRGPLAAGGGDLLKPDVIAPGQDILAAVAPTAASHGLSFNLLSGTSMSSPHVAGLGALLKQAHPTWSPMAIKSSLMTTGYDVLDATSTANRILRQGAGHVAPNSATNPGLVYDSGFDDWRAFLKSQGLCNLCFGTAPAAVIDPSDFNSPSIAIGDLAGIQTVTRTVRNLGGAATYNVNVTAPAGIDVLVTPTTLNVAAGGTASYTVKFTRTDAALGSYTGGQLTWSDGTHSVRSPLIIRPVAIAAPPTRTIAAAADGGSNTWNVKVGYDGTLSANAYGAVPDAVVAGETVVQDPDQSPTTDPFGVGVHTYDFTLGAATQYWAGGTMAATTEAGSDLDVYLLRENANGAAGFQYPADVVASSADGDSEELVQLVHPAADNYRLMVHGWGTPDGTTTYALHWWDVGGASDGGSLVAHAGTGDPFNVLTGDTVAITLDWSGLTAAGTQYRGIVDYVNGAPARIGSTVVILNR